MGRLRRAVLWAVALAVAGLVSVLSLGLVRAWPVIGPDGWNPAVFFTSDEMYRFYELPELAKDAAREKDFDTAREHARELLELAPEFPNNWNFGNAVHDAHIVLGLAALSEGDVSAARSHLLQAGRTPGSPQLDTFGPNMMLAEALLEAGEVEVVLEYFELCRAFWEMHEERLDRWSAEASAGKMPHFGANVRY